jgi:hypothetical protein
MGQYGNQPDFGTRSEGDVPEVTRYNNPHRYEYYDTRTGEHDSYFRSAPVEKDFNKQDVKAYSFDSGVLDPMSKFDADNIFTKYQKAKK